MKISESEIDTVFIESSTVKLRWLSHDTIEIIGADGQSDLIILTPKLSLIGATNDSCTFTGKLEKNPLAEASVVGCQSSKETVVSIGVSNQVKTFIFSKETTLEVNQNIIDHHRRLADEAESLSGREGSSNNLDYDYDHGMRSEVDFVETGEDPPNVAASYEGPLPQEITIVVSLGYDQSFLKHRGNILPLP